MLELEIICKIHISLGNTAKHIRTSLGVHNMQYVKGSKKSSTVSDVWGLTVCNSDFVLYYLTVELSIAFKKKKHIY